MPRASNRDITLTREIESQLAAWRGDTSAIADILEPLHGALHAEKTFAYTFTTERGQPCVDAAFQYRMPNIRNFPQESRAFAHGWSAYDPTRPEARQRNRAVTMKELQRVAGGVGGLVATTYWKSKDLADRDQLRVLICDGPVAVAWVGGFRPGTFDAADRRALQRLVPALQRRLRLESRLRDGDLARATMFAALERLGAPAFVASANGRVQHANSAGQVMLDKDRASVTALLTEGIAQSKPGFTPLQTNGMARHYLATLSTPEPKARAATAADAWSLTPRQREILDLLVEGCSNQVIAACLAISVRTVEVHLSTIYQRVGVEGRGALLARVLQLSHCR